MAGDEEEREGQECVAADEADTGQTGAVGGLGSHEHKEEVDIAMSLLPATTMPCVLAWDGNAT